MSKVKRFQIFLKEEPESYLLNIRVKPIKKTFTKSQMDRFPKHVKEWVALNCDVVEFEGGEENE